MTDKFAQAQKLLNEFKGEAYLHGVGVLPQVGRVTRQLGQRVALVRDFFPGVDHHLQTIRGSLVSAGVEMVGEIEGAHPNAPREDLSRITVELGKLNPQVVLSFGGGSTIDATKAAIVLNVLGGNIDDYFGTGLVTQAMQTSGKTLIAHVAIQTAASSGAHLTKYSNITDLKSGQKKLIVDPAIVPAQPVFDYMVTYGAPASLTADGALDGFSHCLEVLYDSVGKVYYAQMQAVAREGIRLVIEYLPRVMRNLGDNEAREALGLATDLGGCAIMLGGTNGAHLTSFSLIDVLSHGRACAIMNPYYTVFFAPAIQEPLRLVGELFRQGGFTQANIQHLEGRALGIAVAQAMIAFEKQIGFPSALVEVPGFTVGHIERALVAAKNPQLKMKLENMPVKLNAEMVDEYMGAVLQAATSGNLDLVKNLN